MTHAGAPAARKAADEDEAGGGEATSGPTGDVKARSAPEAGKQRDPARGYDNARRAHCALRADWGGRTRTFNHSINSRALCH